MPKYGGFCSTCKHAGDVYNSCHASCKHPAVNEIISNSDDLMFLLDGIVNKKKIPYIHMSLKVDIKKQGIEGGWASWPFNFDPMWLDNCTGYEEVV